MRPFSEAFQSSLSVRPLSEAEPICRYGFCPIKALPDLPANAESTGLQKQGHHSWSHRLFLTPTPTYLLFHVFVFYVLFLVFLFFAVDPLSGPFFVLFQARKCHCCQSAVKRKASIVGESPPMSIRIKNGDSAF